jgi:hypothetical protein
MELRTWDLDNLQDAIEVVVASSLYSFRKIFDIE